jgi:hypothetical protein
MSHLVNAELPADALDRSDADALCAKEKKNQTSSSASRQCGPVVVL